MTRRETELLAFIERYRAETGYSPTYDEMSDALGTAKSNTHRIVHRLIEKGKLIKRQSHSGEVQPRNIVPARPIEVIRRALMEAKLNRMNRTNFLRMIDEAEAALEQLT